MATPPDPVPRPRPHREPPLTSIMATRTRSVEVALAVVTVGLITAIGGFLVIALLLAGLDGVSPLPAGVRQVPLVALLAFLLVGGRGSRWAHRRGGPIMPWALAGAALWLVPVVWALNQLS